MNTKPKPYLLAGFLLIVFIAMGIGTTYKEPQSTPPQGLIPRAPMTSYYFMDQVPNAGDLPKLASWGVNTVVKSFGPSASASTINAYMQAARNAGIMVVVWPSDTSVRPKCPFPYPAGYPDGNIDKVKPLIDKLAVWDNWIGIPNAHEPYWSCIMDEREMTGLRTKLLDYAKSKGRTDIKIWNYIDNIDGHDTLQDSEISQIGDVFVTWQHCAGSAEGSCADAITKIERDRIRADAGGVTLVWLVQTFVIYNSNYDTKFTPAELKAISCQSYQAGSEGLGFYTWDAWYDEDLIAWTDLWPSVLEIKTDCAEAAPPTSTPVPSPTRTKTSTPTVTKLPTVTKTLTPSPTSLPITPTSWPTLECYIVTFNDQTQITICK